MLQPTRVLDALQRNPRLPSLRTHTKRPMSPYSMYTRALEMLGPPTTSTMLPLPVTWKARHLLRNAVEVTSVAGLTAYIMAVRTSMAVVLARPLPLVPLQCFMMGA